MDARPDSAPLPTSPDVLAGAPADTNRASAGSTRVRAVRSRALDACAVLAAVALACAAFWPALGGGFVYDDRVLVAQNPTIRSFAALRGSWGMAYWDFLEPSTAARLGYWRPLTAHALYLGQLLGDGAPWGFHAVSLALHALAVAGAFALARRLAAPARGARAIAFASAVLFGLHPLQVESVAWISSVNDPLYGAALLWALTAFLAWRQRGSRGVPLAACAVFALGLLSKENAVAFLPLALALDLGRARGAAESARVLPRPFVRAWAPLLGVGVAYWAARVAVFGDALGGVTRITNDLRLLPGRGATLRVELLGEFLTLLAWPAKLNLFREVRPLIPAFDARLWGMGAVVLAWLAAVAWAARRGRRPLLAALLMPVASVVPALVRLESLGRFVLSDRFLYVAVFGAAFALTWLTCARLPRWAAGGALAALALAAGAKSRARIADWRDEETLFRATAAASPDSTYAQWGLGRVLLERFQTTGDPRLVQEAKAAFEHVQDLVQPPGGGAPDPQLYYTLDDVLHANCGVGWCFYFAALAHIEDFAFDEAELVFNATLERFPDEPEALVGLGATQVALGNLSGARQSLERAAEIRPRMISAWFNLGRVQMSQGQPLEAAASFERAMAIEPDDPATLLALGQALSDGGGDAARARDLLARAFELQPKSPEVAMQRGALEAREKQWREALRWLDLALELSPPPSRAEAGVRARAQVLRAKVLLQVGDFERAIAALGEACRQAPDDFEAHLIAGSLLAERGFGDAAMPYLERALELAPQGPYAVQVRATLEALRELKKSSGAGTPADAPASAPGAVGGQR